VAGDRFGPRRVFLTGLVLFTAASAGCALAPAIGVLVLIRLIQGAAAALLVPSSLALLQASYPDRAGRARAVGLWGGIGGLAAASGPVLGGALTAAASWRLVFAINIPVGLLTWWLTRRRVASPAGQRDRRGDPIGQITAIVALTALVAGLIEAGPQGWVSWPVTAGLAIAAAGTAAFIAAQRRVRSPMLPLLRRPALSGGSVVGLLINLGFYGQLFAYSLYLQQVRGDSPLIAGLSLLPEAAAVPVASVLSGRLTSRRGPRVTMITGLMLGAAGLLGLIVTAHGTPYWVLVLPMVAAGSGMALTMPAATTAVMDAAPDNRSGTAAGLINTARQVGGALGVAVAGSLVSGAVGFVPGLHVALAVRRCLPARGRRRRGHRGPGPGARPAGVGPAPAHDQPALARPHRSTQPA
jgi:DHA2 family methylenomycin A resistance protein-like MFS transporter